MSGVDGLAEYIYIGDTCVVELGCESDSAEAEQDPLDTAEQMFAIWHPVG